MSDSPTVTQRLVKAVPHGSRFLELVGFATAIGMGLGDKVQEWHGIDRGLSLNTVFWGVLLVAPFTMGRATAGKAWEAIAAGISKRIGGA